MLGPVEVRCGGRVEVLSGRLQRTLFGVLLARVNQPVPVDVLTDTLWGDRPDPRVGQKLQVHVHRLRSVLDEPDRLSFGATGYLLRVRSDEVDAEQFDVLVKVGTEAAKREPQRAIESLRAALALWRGTPFADAETPVLTDWGRRLAERRLVAAESLYEAELACGLHEAVIGELADLVREHPLRERLHGLLMTALYRAGRRSEALEVYRAARHALVSELGVEPGAELRELQRRILAGDLPERTPDRRALREVPAQLPVDVRGFVGRETELAELDGLLSAEAPVVISAVAGTAGVGKTALAVRWAHRVRDRFPDGQLYVDLRGYGPDEPVSPADAVAGFLRALGLDGAAIPEDLEERAARFRTLVDRRRMLILLDNARTVEQVRPLLPAGSSCRTLVTSRDSLAGLVARYGAHRISLDRLSSADAVDLLRELLGARADVEPAAVDALVERCARLPLALRIAAEIVRSRPGRAIGELADELADQQDALDLLAADDDPHTAVRAVFSWSYRRLDPAVARLFRLLGLHHGHDVDVHAMAAMAGTGLRETRRALDVLVRAHLVDGTSGGRYQPHDLLRAYAAELAGTTDDTAAPLARLCDYYLATASAAMDVIAPHEADRRPKVAAPDAESPVFDSYDSAFGWLDGEHVNLLATTQHGGPEYVVKMSDTVWRYLVIGGYHDDAVALHTHALHAAQALGDVAAEANARRVLGAAALRVGFVAQAIDHLERALALYRQVGDRSLQAATLNNIGVVNWRRGDLAAAADCFRHALALYQEFGDQRMRAPATNNLARVLYILGRYAEAFELFEQALVIARDNENRTSEANALCGLAEVSAEHLRQEQALDYARLALTIARQTGHRTLEGTAIRMLGVAYRQSGEHESAVRHLDTALQIARAVGDTEQLVAALNALAAAHASAGNRAEALHLYHEALTTENGRGNVDERAHAHAGIGDVHAALGEREPAGEHWQRALVLYRRLGMPQVDAVAARLDRLERRAPRCSPAPDNSTRTPAGSTSADPSEKRDACEVDFQATEPRRLRSSGHQIQSPARSRRTG
ncbi:AfsR/SARP family transcriptional regulator [Saccharothrix sp. ALI-22-I]|uniref:AfsR/SARP family transcriptional regulator n=1 Tax=Saccharothrix sp. ALI-22-I TaxID=1933778 RepID=UPI0015C2E31C|nr:BTAD domain-containing putative transcriptional regulator [Saccharothrix sp. ALI-22-I]